MKRENRGGYTLSELLIVIALGSGLLGIVISFISIIHLMIERL